MKTPSFIFVLLIASSHIFAAEDPQPSLFVPDGQFLSIPVKVYVSSANLDLTMKPRLQLAGFRAHDRTNVTDLKKWEPFVAAPNQSWTEKVEGQNVTRRGTLLMFDLDQLDLDWYKSTRRVTPILTWQPPDLKEEPAPQIVGHWVYLGSRWNALLWTIAAIGLLVFIVCRMARVQKKSVLHLVAGPDGYMSLWRTQLAIWTLAVGSMVFMFSIIQLGVPRIPESLVVLMGMAVATGSLGKIAGKTPQRAAKPERAPRPLWRHLIGSFNPAATDGVELSVSKAQMVFWTGVIVVLFIVKSLLSGELWEVPWELVTLTGVSQAGYVGDKALQGAKKTPRESP